jgi:hypothetical protein
VNNTCSLKRQKNSRAVAAEFVIEPDEDDWGTIVPEKLDIGLSVPLKQAHRWRIYLSIRPINKWKHFFVLISLPCVLLLPCNVLFAQFKMAGRYDETTTSFQQQIRDTQSELREMRKKIKVLEFTIKGEAMKVDEFEREIRAVQIQMNSATTALRMQSLGKAMEGLANDKMQLHANVVQLRDKKMEYVAIWNRLSIAQAALHLKADALQSAQQMARDNGELPLPCSYTCSSTWIRGHCSDAHVTTVEWLCRNTYSSRCRSRLSRRHTSHQACHLYLTAIIVSNLQETWNLDNLATMLQREKKPLPTGTPEEYIGRNSAIDAIQSAAMENFRHRTSKEHTDFTFLVASGHILSGKTRSGIETPRLVEELCSKLSTHGDKRGTRLEFTKPVYLLIDFMQTSKVNPDFDGKHQGASVTLGARLMCAFYKCDTLKVITHDQALKHIIDSILRGIGDNDSLIVPIVIHFNEHGKFVRRLNEFRKQEARWKMVLRRNVTLHWRISYVDRWRGFGTQIQRALFLVPITTGTSQKHTSFSQLGTYGIKTVPLPPLSLADSRLLASAFLNSRDDKQEILADTVLSNCPCGLWWLAGPSPPSL